MRLTTLRKLTDMLNETSVYMRQPALNHAQMFGLPKAVLVLIVREVLAGCQQLFMQGASLLMFTVYLQIGAQPLSFATAAAVQVKSQALPERQ